MEIEMLQENRLRAWCDRLQMPEGATEALAGVATQIVKDEELHRKFCAFYEQTTLNGHWQRDWNDLPTDPGVSQKLGEQSNLFYLLGYMAALPSAEREYRRLGIGLDVFHDTMRDITLWMNHAYDLHGTWRFNQFSWIWRHVDCKLFRLGRLQFMLADFPGKVTAFKNRATGGFLLLGDPTTPLRPDGYAEGAGGSRSGEEPWHAVFEELPAGWRGNRVTPQGYTLTEQSFLLRSEWERVLQHGDTILDLHIPRGIKLTADECRDSFEKAYRFFPTFWPDRPFKGIYCHTWFFTPQLQKILPADSNIVRFQREFYLYPFVGGPAFLWSFVFGEKFPDAATAPHDTALRAAVLDWINQGGELFDMPGVMLHKPEQWGTQPYYPPENPEGQPEPKPIVFEETPEDDWMDDTDEE